MNVPEIPDENWETLLVLQRHGKYDSRHPANYRSLGEEERAFGHLTEEGKAEAGRRADERLEAILSQSPESTDFLILNSPTYWLDNEQLGQRAKETAEVIAAEIAGALQTRRLPPEQLLNTSGAFKGETSRPDGRLGEALMFQVPEFANALRKAHGGQGPEFWKAFYRDEHQELREQLGTADKPVEGPAEIAARINQSVHIMARFAQLYHFHHPGRRLVVWMVSHGDGLNPYAQRVLGVPEEDFSTDYNDGIGIAIDSEGNAKTTVKGRDYQVPLGTHGSPASVQSNQ